MTKQVSVGAISMNAPDDTKVLDLGKRHIAKKLLEEERRGTTDRCVAGLIIMTAALAIVFASAFLFKGLLFLLFLIPFLVILGLSYEGIQLMKLSSLQKEQKRIRKWLKLARRYNGSIYEVASETGSKYFLYGKKNNYFILFPLPEKVKQEKHLAHAYLHSVLITKYRKETKVKGTLIGIVKEKEVWDLFGSRKIPNPQDTIIGDPDFDSNYVVVSNKKENCVRYLDSQIRVDINALAKGKFGLKLSDRGVSRYMELREKVASPEEVEGWIEILYRLTKKLDRSRAKRF